MLVIKYHHYLFIRGEGPGGSMSKVVGLRNNSCKPITNTAWVHARLWKLQKGCTRLATESDQDYQLLAHGRWFSPGTPASSTTKTGRYDIAEICLKVALNTKNKSNHLYEGPSWSWSHGSWLYSYLCNQCLSSLMLWVQISIKARCTILCNKVFQWHATGRWVSRGSLVSSTNKTDRHDKTEILLKVALNILPILIVAHKGLIVILKYFYDKTVFEKKRKY